MWLLRSRQDKYAQQLATVDPTGQLDKRCFRAKSHLAQAVLLRTTLAVNDNLFTGDVAG